VCERERGRETERQREREREREREKSRLSTALDYETWFLIQLHRRKKIISNGRKSKREREGGRREGGGRERGREGGEERKTSTRASIVRSKSLISPSVMIRSTK
jgi:hypothetical protein